MNNNFYPIKHWLITLAIGFLLLAFYEALFSSNIDAIGLLQTYPLFFMFGLFLSLPVLLFYFIAFKILAKTIASPLTIKGILNIAAVIGVVVTFRIIDGSLTMSLSITYSIAILFSSLFIRLKNNDSHPQ